MLRRRRPLLRAAAVAGAGYIAGKKMGEAGDGGQGPGAVDEGGAAPPAPAPAEPASAGISQSSIERLKQLASLRDEGVLTDEEFNAEKQKVLGGPADAP